MRATPAWLRALVATVCRNASQACFSMNSVASTRDSSTTDLHAPWNRKSREKAPYFSFVEPIRSNQPPCLAQVFWFCKVCLCQGDKGSGKIQEQSQKLGTHCRVRWYSVRQASMRTSRR